MCRKEPGMKINRVTLYNFSSYVGENTIALGTHNEQNIILIGGNNGAGKTSFFTAIKLALYGPQCFRFQDKNNRYTARIKELINHDAFLSDNVKAYVEVEIDLPTDRVHTLYTIRREWSFIEKRLHENYTVYKEHQLLADKNLDFFQNYDYQRCGRLQKILRKKRQPYYYIQSGAPCHIIASNEHLELLGDSEHHLPGVISLIVNLEDFDNERFVKRISAKFAVSTGSACTAGMPSHVLQAIGKGDAVSRVLRISLSAENTIDQVEAFLKELS